MLVDMAYIRKLQNKNDLHFINVPKQIVHAFDWRYGDLLIFVVREGNEVALMKVDLTKRPDLKIHYDGKDEAKF